MRVGWVSPSSRMTGFYSPQRLGPFPLARAISCSAAPNPPFLPTITSVALVVPAIHVVPQTAAPGWVWGRRSTLGVPIVSESASFPPTRFCGIHTPSSVCKCLTTNKWFCNARINSSASCIIHHLVRDANQPPLLSDRHPCCQASCTLPFRHPPLQLPFTCSVSRKKETHPYLCSHPPRPSETSPASVPFCSQLLNPSPRPPL